MKPNPARGIIFSPASLREVYMDINSYLSLFPGATREKPRFMALAQAVLVQAADLAALVLSLPEAYSLGLAVGRQLDCLAAALGLTRTGSPQGAGATDEQFRAFIREKLALWRTDGTNGDNE